MWGNKLVQAIESDKPFVLVNKPNSTEIQLFVDDEIGEEKVRFHRFDSQNEIVISDQNPIFISVDEFDFSSDLNLKSQTKNLGLTKDSYLELLHETIDYIRNSPIQKIVLSRVKSIENEGFDLFQSFKKLTEIHPSALVYLWHRPNHETWLGATPELLLKQVGNKVETVSLAGTKSPENKWTKKEVAEQQLVTDYIVESFSEVKNLQIIGPETIQAGRFQHLKSYISGEIPDEFDLNSLLMKLHPTPAVCGLPKRDSFDYIIANEGYDRDFYSGFIGFESQIQKEYFVNLRCAQIYSNQIALYVGGGILANSVPENEWNETELKSTTILNGLCKSKS